MADIKIGANVYNNVAVLNIPFSDEDSYATFGQTKEFSWNQIPALVRKYLENTIYDPEDYTVSSIADYAPQTADKDNSYPIGVEIETSEGVLARNEYEIEVSDGTAIIYNDIPNRFTGYVVRKDGVVIQAGTLKPTGALRQIKCTTTNVRDLGGWACDGGTVKYGKLFRGGEIDRADIDMFRNQLGIRHELNLRGLSESHERDEEYWDKSILGDDVGYTCPEKYVWYQISDTTTWKEILRCIFDCVAENKPLFLHCAAGADRTGTVACIIEAILGLSQSDIDKDYELTCFMTGTETDTQARRRNESDWKGQISAITSLTVGSIFRDKVLNWVASLGFTAGEINSFRNAMIDGRPDMIALDIDTYSVTNTLTNITSDNDSETVTQYQPYEAEITVPDGYVIEKITVTMGGTDITSEVFNGTPANLYRAISENLTKCSLDNKRNRVIDGQGYVANIIANNGYYLDDETVSIMMGGVDVSTYYSAGKIAIPNVTGDIFITAEAVESAEKGYVNKMVVQESNLNMRISGTTIGSAMQGVFITDPIEVDLSKECPVIFKNFASTMGVLEREEGKIYANSKVALLDSSQAVLAVWYIGGATITGVWKCVIDGDDVIGDLSTILNLECTAGTMPSVSDVKYVVFSPQLNDTQTILTIDDLADLEIQMLED